MQDFIKVKETFAYFCPVEGTGTTQSLLLYELYFQWLLFFSLNKHWCSSGTKGLFFFFC